MKISRLITITVLIMSYLFALIVIYQVIRAIIGGTWTTENIIISLVILNLTATLTMIGLFMDLRSKFYGHLGWHKGYEKGLYDRERTKK